MTSGLQNDGTGKEEEEIWKTYQKMPFCDMCVSITS